MDERKEYTSFAIPQREAPPAKTAVTPDTAAQKPAAALSFSDAGFAEVEISSGPANASSAEKALRFYSSVTAPEPITERAYDPLRVKFYDMRSLATDRPFARDDAELFYKQAVFMEDFTDDFKGDAKFFMYYPLYQHMGYEQLRTYFTWRTKMRKGEVPTISVSYVFLYVYELINNVGVADPPDGLGKLLAVWDNCLKFAPALENYMPWWFRDYFIYYGIPGSFADFVKEHGLTGYFLESFLFDEDLGKSFDLWNGLSAYDATKSKFWAEGNEQLIKDCFFAVLDGIRRLCSQTGIKFEDLFIYSIGRRALWQPFRQALFHHWYKQEDRTVELPGMERYYVKNNRFSASLPMYFSTQREFIGYLIKKTESCLRQALKYKYKLTAAPTARYDTPLSELKRLGNQRDVLENAIEKSVADFYRDSTRTVVTVDLKNLERIREESLETQGKLIVTEEDEGELGVRSEEGELGVRSEELGVMDASKPETKPSEADLALRYGVPEQSGSSSLRERNGAEDETTEELGVRNSEFGIIDGEDGWEALGNALSPLERQALLLVLKGDADIKAFADQNGIMLEVLADNINEKAADMIGDSILEIDETMNIFDEYRSMVERMIKTMENDL